MSVTCISSDQREEWNAFVAREPSFALLQSWEWGEFKEKLGWKAFRIAVREQKDIIAGAQMLIKPFPMKLGSIAYIPRGPIGKWLDTEIAPKLLSEIHRISHHHKAIFLKIEPPLLYEPGIDQVLQQHHFRATPQTNQPRTTITLDLNMDLDDILMQMRKKTRQHIRSAVREGITVRIGVHEDLSAFYNLVRMTSQREQFRSRIRAYYEHEWQTFAENNQTVLLMAFYQGQLLSVRTACYFGKHAAEFHAGSLDSPANLHPNYSLVWEAIKWAKAQGCCTYDLWGIPDEIGEIISKGNDPPVTDRTDGLWGVYRFKSGFSKNIIYYVGAYDYIYKPLPYALISNKLVNSNRLDRVLAWMDRLKSN